jgi:hypothetical protein
MISKIENEIVYTFPEEFCNQIIESLNDKDIIIIQYKNSAIKNESNQRVESNQPTNADGWDFNKNKEVTGKIINVVNDYIENIEDYKFVVQRLDKTKKSSPHYDHTDYTVVLLLNDKFSGGELIIEDVESNLKKGNLILFKSNKLHHVSKLTEGERYTLVGFISQKKKNKKTLI